MKPIISLSFDDGRLDNYQVFKEILEPNHIPVTINIATGFIEHQCTVGSSAKPLTIPQIQEMATSPLVEFACHGHMHTNEAKDIQKGRQKLARWLNYPPNTALGFASPGSDMTPDYIRSHKKQLTEMHFAYVRTGLELKKHPTCKIVCRKASRILHSKTLYTFAYRDSMQQEEDGLLITSVPILKDTSLREIKSLVQYAKKHQCLLTLMFHSIVEDDQLKTSDNWSYSYSKFQELCQFLKSEKENDSIVLCKTMDAYQKMKERKL